MQSLDKLKTASVHTNVNDLNKKVCQTIEKCDLCLYSIANEPTLGCFCIQNSNYKNGLNLIKIKEELKKLEIRLKLTLLDVDYSIDVINQIKESKPIFENCQELIKNSLFYKCQKDHQDTLKNKNRLVFLNEIKN